MKTLYFIRIGGTAMGGVAAACQKLGYRVIGSEAQLYEPMKSYLADNGVEVIPRFDPQNLHVAQPDEVVVGNAVSRGNEELEEALDLNLRQISLPELVGRSLIADNTSVVVAGTHGKTTTTAMVAWMLESAGLHPGFLIGGVPANFDVSCRPAFRTDGKRGVFVVEGDEYDSAYFDKRSKILHYKPTIAVLNNAEFDHSDIFDSLEDILKSFRLYLRLVPRKGLILVNGDDPNIRRLIANLGLENVPIQTFGTGEQNDWVISNIESTAQGGAFDLTFRGEYKGRVSMDPTGEINARNMTVACAVATHLGVPFDAVLEGAKTYRHPKRRMEVIGTWHGATVIDDFGHHPTAIKETLKAISAKYPGRRILAAFEPRSNTTTRNVFQKELAECFAEAAGVAIGSLDRPHRYDDSQRLDLDKLKKDLESQGKLAYVLPLERAGQEGWGAALEAILTDWVEENDLIVLFSNGDFGGLRARLKG